MAGWGLWQSGCMGARHLVFHAHVIALGFKFCSWILCLYPVCG